MIICNKYIILHCIPQQQVNINTNTNTNTTDDSEPCDSTLKYMILCDNIL